MFTAHEERPQWEILFNDVKDLPTGTLLPYHKMSLPYRQAIALRDRVAKQLGREQGRYVVCVRGEGWKVVAGPDHRDAGTRIRKAATRKLGRAVQVLETVDRREMSALDQERTDSELINAKLGYGMLRGLAIKRLSLADIVQWKGRA